MSTRERRCRATRDDGSPCGAPAELVDAETGLCPAHRPDARERLQEAGRKGAEARHGKGADAAPAGLSAEELPWAASWSRRRRSRSLS